jgi:transcriptional regulator with XRE-family HTH domain
MSKYQIGSFIKMKREELGITQEELADGIISVASLSRIENGGRTPRKENLQSILQRLGYSDSVVNNVSAKEDLSIYLMRYELRQAYIMNDHKKAEQLLSEFKSIPSELSPVNRQVYEEIDTLLKFNKKEISNEEALKRLENALRLTCPKYTRDNLPKFLTYEEILILNNIALRLNYEGNSEKTIEILYHIKNYYDKHICDIEEALRTQPMILYNLSKFLGLAGRFDESISVCNQGIKLARETGRCSHLAKTLYNLARDLYERNEPGDRESSKYNALQAYYLAIALKKEKSAKHYKEFLIENFESNLFSL